MHEDRLESMSQGVIHLVRVIKQAFPDGPPPKPIDRFKGFQKDAGGNWRFAHRVTQPHHTGALNNSIMDRFKR
jgi:hypothetical protein